MASVQLGLGKGLGALIRETTVSRATEDVHTLPLKDIQPNPKQPRRTFTDSALAELADSIRKQGVLQPILVRPLGDVAPGKYEIVAGERRWRASRLAGLVEVPVTVRAMTDQEALAIALIENLQREDLSPIEEAQGMQLLRDEFNMSQEELAMQLGKSRSAIANSLRLLTLPESVRNALSGGLITAGHARALLSVTDEAAQKALLDMILADTLSVREAEGLAARWKDTGSLHLADPAPVANTKPKTPSILVTALRENQKESDSDAEPRKKTEKSRSRRIQPQSALIVNIQSQISKALSVPVRVIGKESKGKITVSYSSKEELETILARLASISFNED